MPQNRIAIWGASGHALVVVDILRLQGNYVIAGLIDDINPNRHGTQVWGIPVLGGAEVLDGLMHEGVTHLVFGFGNCSARLRLASLVESKKFQFATAIHPHAIIAADASIGAGTVVVAGAVVNPGARIGRNCIINTCVSVDHECVISEAVHLSPGVRLGGGVTVGESVWIGIGATVIDKIRIGANSIIGAGAVVTKDVPSGVVAYGVPARIIRSIEEKERPNGV